MILRGRKKERALVQLHSSIVNATRRAITAQDARTAAELAELASQVRHKIEGHRNQRKSKK